jgi:hypothetical protein
MKLIKKSSWKAFFNPLTILVSVILLIGLVLLSLAVIFLGRNPVSTGAVLPDITKIAAPSLTPKPLEPTEIPSPTATPIFFLPEGVIGVGGYVQVIGTGGAGLRMRAEPGLDGAIQFTALDSEAFLVIDGPVDADGYIWWHLEAPYDKTRNGWSAGDFLTPLQGENN